MTKDDLLNITREFLDSCFNATKSVNLTANEVKKTGAKAFIKSSRGYYKGLKIEISNMGGFRYYKIPWIVFLNNQNKTIKGIYPLILADVKDAMYSNGKLKVDICYGISEKYSPVKMWGNDILSKPKTLYAELFPNCRIHKTFYLKDLAEFEEIKDELFDSIETVINVFNEIYNIKQAQHPVIKEEVTVITSSCNELTPFSDVQIWNKYSDVVKELKKRGLIRTNNIVGERGEFLAKETYNSIPSETSLTLCNECTQNIDAIGKNGARYSIKTVTHPNKQTGVIYDDFTKENFEYLIIVLIDNNFELFKMYELSWETVNKFKKWHKTMQAYNLSLTSELISNSRVVYQKN